MVGIYSHWFTIKYGLGKPPQIVWTHPLLPQKCSEAHAVVLSSSNRTNHIEVIPCVIQIHRPLLQVIHELSIDIVRGVPLSLAMLVAERVDRCPEGMGQA